MDKIDKDKIHKILVVRTDRMGDVLLNIPAIRALKQSFNATVFALVNPVVKELLEGLPEIDQVLPFVEGRWNRSIFARLKLLREMRKMQFDLAVILNPTKRFHILTYLAGIGLRLGYARKWDFLLSHKIEDKKFLGQKHEVEYNLDLVRSIGADTSDQQISIKAEKQDTQFVENLLLEYGIKDKDIVIAIHPHSSNPAKCWPKENFASVADELSLRFSAKVVITGSAQERSSVVKLISLTKHPLINLCGRLSLKQLAAFFLRCSLLISNDSGPVHIAAAVATPTVVIFGRNMPAVGPKRWGPWGSGHITLHKDPGCSPCLDRDCPYNFKCLTSITPEEVLAVVEQRLAGSCNLSDENSNSKSIRNR